MLLTVAAFIGGAIASVTGFGIGSILTPLLAVEVGTKTAVAAVSIPHVLATGLRLWLLRTDVDRTVLIQFGVPSALGGLAGALLHSEAANPVVSGVFAGLLLFAGISELTGLSEHIRFGPKTAWIAGAVSGLLGGFVGNQGGIRAAGLLGFDIRRTAFVATATATGLIVDAVRMPVYFLNEFHSLVDMWQLIALLSIAVLIGTVVGERTLHCLPEQWFQRAVAVILLGLGTFMLYQAFG